MEFIFSFVQRTTLKTLLSDICAGPGVSVSLCDAYTSVALQLRMCDARMQPAYAAVALRVSVSERYQYTSSCTDVVLEFSASYIAQN